MTIRIRTTRRARTRVRRKLIAGLVATSMAALLSACGAGTGSGPNEINWWTWDDKQAAGYEACATAFEKANPGVHVKISQYQSTDYFTKLLANFVAGTAPDAFQNSPQFFQQYASLNQLMPLDDLMARTGYDLDKFSTGTNTWKYTDGKQYGLPLDWASAAFFYSGDTMKKAGYTAADLDSMTWNPDDGGSFDKVVAHLTVDKKGVRGDEPGFDKKHVATFGIGTMGTKDFTGQMTWAPFLLSMGWHMGDKALWPTKFNYDDPRFARTMKYIRSLSDRGFAPRDGEFASAGNTPSGPELIGSGKVALMPDGSWAAANYALVPKLKIKIAPTVLGPDGKTRGEVSSSNGNNIWAGTPHPDLTWKWVSYMGSEDCQTRASAGGSFFPSIPAAMDASAKSMLRKGVDLSVFIDQQKNGELNPSPPYGNGTELQAVVEPLIQEYFSHGRNEDVFAQMAKKTKSLLAEGK
ncbi:ABC transporter substrate-binding protein [Streptomyces sp. NPDC088725]|uniref:ABC transporter substrate-binding protein n=1 Tax=Streptomyces sp. NPDC088725 TaxID=3365873 RepID=UPI00382B1372